MLFSFVLGLVTVFAGCLVFVIAGWMLVFGWFGSWLWSCCFEFVGCVFGWWLLWWFLTWFVVVNSVVYLIVDLIVFI